MNTGFAAVARNLIKRWDPHFDVIDIWGINYNGWPVEPPWNTRRIYPAGFQGWNSGEKLSMFLNLLSAADYTHLWILMDTHQLASGNFPKIFNQVTTQKKIHTTFYYPVDAMLDKKWMECVAQCDVAVTYTEFGRKETVRVRPGMNPHVIGHGVDTEVFHPREDRMTLREKKLGGWVQSEDFLMVDVNRNERRKAPQHALQILAELRKRRVRAKLIMHCPNVNPIEGTSLEAIGEQLGLPVGEHWCHNDDFFVHLNPQMTEDGLNELYNEADLVLSTSTGEGWGFSLTDGLAAGCAVVAPEHTSCLEIADTVLRLDLTAPFRTLPLSSNCVVNALDSSRVRWPVDVLQSASVIQGLYEHWKDGELQRYVMSDAMKDWLSWDRLAQAFLELMLKK